MNLLSSCVFLPRKSPRKSRNREYGAGIDKKMAEPDLANYRARTGTAFYVATLLDDSAGAVQHWVGEVER